MSVIDVAFLLQKDNQKVLGLAAVVLFLQQTQDHLRLHFILQDQCKTTFFWRKTKVIHLNAHAHSDLYAGWRGGIAKIGVGKEKRADVPDFLTHPSIYRHGSA